MSKLKLNLTERYADMNKLIFQESLPTDIHIGWNQSRKSMGKTTIRRHHDGSRTYSIKISRFFLCTEKEYTETLIHEMIHLHMAISGEFERDSSVHGVLFKKHMNRINRDFPEYAITVREENRKDVDLSMVQERNGFFVKTEKAMYFNLYHRPLNGGDIKMLIRALRRGFGIKRGELYTFSGKYPLIATAPVRRKPSTLRGKLQYLKDEREMESLYRRVKVDCIEKVRF